ncbi:GNAT family N-acetyltransferase [Streptomyces fradiae]|uniref:GNAT family N-acetyltransferase n=1 Tax=Streptomyces fradiae TaxID=1906 RepID=UPI002941FEDB|nr:GNAT family N-acetyltransferase [Streptomyces fradiae]WOI62631.1 GNAT family N-acetyltransferase [Streptomyces fradiae]
MEFTAGGRLEVQITPFDVGKRVSVRRLGDPASQTETFTDTVGVLTSWDEGVLLITRRTGETVRIAESSLVAGKAVPAAPARRRGPAAGFGELARAQARAWQPEESRPLGQWTLRAARGFTRRANSVLAVGDPGMPLDDALARVRAWYGERGLPAYVQAATGAEGTQEALCAALEERGWRREVSAEVRIGGLAPVADLGTDLPGAGLPRTGLPGTGPGPGPDGASAGVAAGRVTLSRTPDAGWLRRYQRVGEPGPHVLNVLSTGPSVWFASVRGGGGVPVAIGRCVVDARWAGFMAVEVDPAYRRRGLARAVMAALAGRALEEGASAAWLQVETGNTAARALYDGMGFAVHHLYHHFRAS